MKKIPKEIVDKVEQRNKLNEEIKAWCEENLDMEGVDSNFADITDCHKGKIQTSDDYKEWIDQYRGCCEDEYYGDSYWETEYPGKYLHMDFWV